jgi:hypothetical protein
MSNPTIKVTIDYGKGKLVTWHVPLSLRKLISQFFTTVDLLTELDGDPGERGIKHMESLFEEIISSAKRRLSQ